MPKLSRRTVYKLIDGERSYKDKKWQQDPSLPPSDELRVVRKLLALADEKHHRAITSADGVFFLVY